MRPIVVIAEVGVMLGLSASSLFIGQIPPAIPTSIDDIPLWTNLGASVVLGGLAVYMATKTIPQIVKDFREETRAAREANTMQFSAEREAHRLERGEERKDHREQIQQMMEVLNRLVPKP
jgi:Sec-independent protein translocase protein TatA